MILNYLRKNFFFLLVVLLSTVLLISHTLYVLKTYQYPDGGLDEPVYLSNAIDNYHILLKPSLRSISQIISVNKGRQPLYSTFIALPLLIFGTMHTYKIALWINIVFYLTTIIGI